jgi:hypothetical protein
MTWIKVNRPGPEHPDVAQALESMHAYPPEYAAEKRAERQVPPLVMNDSIVLAHSLMPEAMKLMMGGLAAMMDPSLPLTRKEHEMIAATVSRLNQCFY